jgi:hypothetical protein
MPADDLHRTLYVPDLLVNALSQDPDRPLLHLLDGPDKKVLRAKYLRAHGV